MDVFRKLISLDFIDALFAAFFWKSFVMLFAFGVIVIHTHGF